ncbi:MAG: T9SS type A sorting domain-containing protein, partial [Flavobacterium sp.]
PTTVIQQTNVRSGLYSVKVSGSVSVSTNAVYRYKTSEVQIPITTNMKLSFWKKTENELAKYIFVDLITASGKKVSTQGYNDQSGNSMRATTPHGTVGEGWEKFTCDLGRGTLLGDTIVGITLNYETTGTGAFEAYFDDFLIEESQSLDIKDNTESIISKIAVYPNPSTGQFNFENLSNKEVEIVIYELNGELIQNSKSNATNIVLDLTKKPNGIYLLHIKEGNNNYVQKLIKN